MKARPVIWKRMKPAQANKEISPILHKLLEVLPDETDV
jgi:hypothetical protein